VRKSQLGRARKRTSRPVLGEPRDAVELRNTDEQRIEGRASHAWRALRHRNFQLFVGGQSISLIGTWMTRVATGWLVYRLTGSALLLGTVSFAGQNPHVSSRPVCRRLG